MPRRSSRSTLLVPVLSAILLFLASCGSTEPIVVKETVVSEVPITVVVVVTATPRSAPRPTPTSERSLEELREELHQVLAEEIEKLRDVDRVNLVRFDTGLLELELNTAWASQDNQPEVSWLVITNLAEVFADTDPDLRIAITGSEDLVIRLTTYSAGGDYRYRSATDFATLMKLDRRSISYEEWIEAANAGFR